MQSILQYRSFERRLRAQIERHGLDATSGVKPSAPGTANDTVEASNRKDEEAGPPATSDARDHTLEEKKTQPDGTVGTKDLAPAKQDRARPEDLSGSTTRTSSSSSSSSSSSTTADDVPDQMSRATTQDKETGAMSRASTRGTMGTRLGTALTGVNVRSRQTNEGKGEQSGKVFVVGFTDHKDPLNPHNWSFLKRILVTLEVAAIGLIVGFASSVDSALLKEAMKEFGVSEVAESLATGIYLVGFGFGAFFAAPISETVGRNPVYIVTMTLYMIFVMASGLAPNIGAQLVFRFLAGFFGSTPLTCAGGTISDMWTPSERTLVFPIFANSAFWVGPILGPIIGGFIGHASAQGIISWRWSEWVTLIWSGLILGAAVLFMPETYSPTLLKWKAAHLRKLTGDDRYMSSLEVQDTKFWHRLFNNMYRPFVLFAFEPIVDLFALYLTVIYIILFTFLTGFDFIFGDVFGLNQGLTFLTFLGIGVGFFGGSALVPWVYKRYKRQLAKVEAEGGSRLPPEQRLIFAMIGAPFLPIGMFWMAWTAYPSISLWPCLVATVPVGFAIIAVFISTYQYLIDAFEAHAASALVGVTFVRYVVAGGMVEVSIPMYENLGVHWTLTMLGAISAVMAPVPFGFYKYGAKIRTHSRYATDFGASK